jgi:SAM-dependent methyltransferase
MTKTIASGRESALPAHESYPWAQQFFDRATAFRPAAWDAGFLHPHLQPGMCLLDCGCRLGRITLGLAQAVAPGKVIGIDIRPEIVEAAKELVLERRVPNVRFRVGDLSISALHHACGRDCVRRGRLRLLPQSGVVEAGLRARLICTPGCHCPNLL